MQARNPDGRDGEVFDAVADAYDRERPGYPAELVDTACAIGGLGEGSRVLEIGCGSATTSRPPPLQSYSVTSGCTPTRSCAS